MLSAVRARAVPREGLVTRRSAQGVLPAQAMEAGCWARPGADSSFSGELPKRWSMAWSRGCL